MNPKFLLLVGPSGVGKSTLIQRLKLLDSRFLYISPFVTRPLRHGEFDKISVTNEELELRMQRGEMLAVNELYGVRYGTPRQSILEAFEKGCFPILDWPLDRLSVMESAFPGRILTVAVLPPSEEVLRHRLSDGRDPQGIRLALGIAELQALAQGEISVQHSVVNQEAKVAQVADEIYRIYLRSLGEGE